MKDSFQIIMNLMK